MSRRYETLPEDATRRQVRGARSSLPSAKPNNTELLHTENDQDRKEHCASDSGWTQSNTKLIHSKAETKGCTLGNPVSSF